MRLSKYQTIALVVLLLNSIYLAVFYNGLPEIMPHHFNIKGEADGFGSKKTLIIMPVVALFMFFTMYAASKSNKYNLPKGVSIETARKSIGQLAVSMQIIFLLLTYTSITSGLEKHNPLEGWILPMILALTFLPIIGMFFTKPST